MNDAPRGTTSVWMDRARPALHPLDADTAADVAIVGAGGIGLELMAALRLIRYDQVSAILLTTLVCVEIVDGLGDTLRRRLR